MSIQRTALPFEDHFTQLPNAWLRDKRLSRKARGILAELMTHRIGWVVTVDSLVQGGPEGRDAIVTGLNELKTLGYLIVQKQHGANGQFEANYVITDPGTSEAEESTDTGLSVVGSTVVGKSAPKNTREEDQLEEDQSLQEASLLSERRSELEIPDIPPIIQLQYKTPVYLPEGFSVTHSMMVWALGKGYDAEFVAQATEEFELWARSSGTKNAKKRDWLATWQAWLNRTVKEQAVRDQRQKGWQRPTLTEQTLDVQAKLRAREGNARQGYNGLEQRELGA